MDEAKQPARFEQPMRETRWHGKCASCKKRHTILTNHKTRISSKEFYRSVDGSSELQFDNGRLLKQCECGFKSVYGGVLLVRVQGKFRAEVKCDARCTHAKGHSCECSCGGKNHGSEG